MISMENLKLSRVQGKGSHPTPGHPVVGITPIPQGEKSPCCGYNSDPTGGKITPGGGALTQGATPGGEPKVGYHPTPQPVSLL